MNSTDEYLFEGDNESKIYAWQVAHLYATTKIAFYTNAVFSLIVSAVLWQKGIHEHVILWISVLWFVLIIRLFTYSWFKKSSKNRKKLNFYCNAFVYEVVATGLLWGLAPWIFGDPAKPEISMFLGFLIGGLISGAVGTLSVLSRVYMPYLIVTLVPMGSWFFLQDDSLHLAIALISFFAFFGFIFSSLSYKKILYESFDLAIKVSEQKLQVEKASNAKSEFLSNMSHELRTPLNAILGFAQLIQLNKETNDLNQRHAKEVVSAGTYLLTLIDDLLEISTIEANKLQLKIEPLQLTELINECVDMIKASDISDLNISIDFNLSDCKQLVVLVDEIRIKQVLLNLLSNACKYNKANGTITLGCRTIDESHIRVFVRDTGQGIPLSKQSDVFDSYQRLGQEKGSIKGTGLGLVISRQLVEMMGGQLGFESKENQGSNFWVDLPLGKKAN